ncbi:MAG: winged helix-turn-helix domain-containing protein [Oceanobacter sp.]
MLACYRFTAVILLLLPHSVTAELLAGGMTPEEHIRRHIDWLYEQDRAVDHTQVRIKIASSTLIQALLVWNAEGEQLYPSPGSADYFDDHGVSANQLRMQSLINTAHPFAWERQDIYGHSLLHCRTDGIRLCLQLDSKELSRALGLEQAELLHLLFANHVQSDGQNADETRSWLGPVSLFLLAIMAGLLWHWRWRNTNQPRAANATEPAEPYLIKMADMLIDPRQMTIHRQQWSAAITQRDLKLLSLFCQRPNEVIGKDELYDIGWGRDFMPSSRALEQHIFNLRRKLDPQRSLPPLIETVHGQGYRFPNNKPCS